MLLSFLRFEEEDRRTSGSDRVEALGGNPEGRLQAHPGTCGNQTAAPPGQTRNRTGQSHGRPADLFLSHPSSIETHRFLFHAGEN